MLEEAERVKQGLEPKGVIRDPRTARFVQLPIIGRDFFLAGYSLRDVADGNNAFRYPKQFIFQAGQPEEIAHAYQDAMGMWPDGSPRSPEEVAAHREDAATV